MHENRQLCLLLRGGHELLRARKPMETGEPDGHALRIVQQHCLFRSQHVAGQDALQAMLEMFTVCQCPCIELSVLHPQQPVRGEHAFACGIGAQQAPPCIGEERARGHGIQRFALAFHLEQAVA